MGEIRFVGTSETRGHPYLVCKKEKSITGDHCSASLGKPRDADQ